MAIKVTTPVVKCMKNVLVLIFQKNIILRKVAIALFSERRKLQLYEWKFYGGCIGIFRRTTHLELNHDEGTDNTQLF